MKKHLFTLACLLAAFMPMQAQEYTFDSLKIDGHMRLAELYRPAGMKPGAPMLVVLNGYNKPDALHNKSIVAAADKHKFAVCWLKYLLETKGMDYWNVGYPFQAGFDVDDEKAICTLTRYMRSRYNLSQVNTFIVGMSHGGDMVYRLAMHGQDVFKAVSSVSGLIHEWMYRTLDAPKPLPLFQMHGTNDHSSPFNGLQPNNGKWGTAVSVPIGIGYWVARDKCMREVCDTIPSMNKKAKNVIVRHKYVGGINGSEVWLYVNVGGGHGWPVFDLNVGEALWDFFSKYIE